MNKDFYTSFKNTFNLYEEGLLNEGEVNGRLQEILPPHWIPLQNNQPEEGRMVLVSCGAPGKQEVIQAKYHRLPNDELVFVSESYNMIRNATHWMPLPKTAI